MVRRCALVGALVLVSLATPASSHAAVIFGSDLDPNFPPITQPFSCAPNTCTDLARTFHAGNAHPATAPISGVVTSVRYRSNTQDVATLRLARVDEYTGQATGVGTGPTVTLVGNGEITEVPVQPGLPIQAGDYLAGEGVSGTAFNCDQAGGSFDLYTPPLVNGAPPRSPTQTNSNCEVLVQGTIELVRPGC